MKYYELRIYIDSAIVDKDTREKYINYISHKQKQFELYKLNENLDFNSQFDIFVPKINNIFSGAISIKINHGIKCAMFIIDKNNQNNQKHPKPTPFYLYPNFNTGSETSLRLSNSVGIINSGYNGYIIGLFDHRGGHPQCDVCKSNVIFNNFDNDNHVQHVKKMDCLLEIRGPDISYPIYPILVDNEIDINI